jgi:hypothetical protein
MSNKQKQTEISYEEEVRGRETQLVREEDRYAREVDERVRNNYYDIPDFDSFNDYKHDVLQLQAPPPLIDPKYGEMQQIWVNCRMNAGGRVHELRRKGYALRDPSTVPPTFEYMTRKWHNMGTIMCGDDLVLMHIPKIFYTKLKDSKLSKSREIMRTLKNDHGTVYRDGVRTNEKLRGVGEFVREEIFESSKYRSKENIGFAAE